jgi:hypothetical protein
MQLSEGSVLYIVGFWNACSLPTASDVCQLLQMFANWYFIRGHDFVMLFSFSSHNLGYVQESFEIVGQHSLWRLKKLLVLR